jgi:polysaccharide export outer membrane protein
VTQLGRLSTLAILFAALLLSSCGASELSGVPGGSAAYAIVPPKDPAAAPASYHMVPGDVLNLQVFQEPDLSNDKLQVDGVGNVQIPLIGEVAAAGRTPSELAADIASRLGKAYLVDPQVVVSVAQPATRYVTIEGQVKKPGVYEMDGDYTLLSAIARAESPTSTAKLDEVVVLRTIDGQQKVARFDLNDIRSGHAPDPQILPGDVVVVGFSGLKGVWRDFLRAAPVFGSFVYLAK